MMTQAHVLRYGYPAWLDPKVVMEMLDRQEAMPMPFIPITAMAVLNYESFLKQGRYRSIYDRGLTWHGRFGTHQQIMTMRKFNDMRLYGRISSETVYAVGMTQEEDAMIQVDKKKVIQYLSVQTLPDDMVLVRWKPNVLEGATFCYGEGQQNMMVYPYTPERVGKLLKIIRAANNTRNAMGSPSNVCQSEEENIIFRKMYLENPIYFTPYFEVQIHRDITPDDVEGLELL